MIFRLSMFYIILIISFFPLSGCSINRMAVNILSDTLAKEGSTVFTGDDDPILVGEALPFALKLYELILDSDPENKQLLLAAGKAFCLYAFAYVQTPAEMFLESDLKKKETWLLRAKKIYLRAKRYLLKALILQNSNFTSELDKNSLEQALGSVKKDDVPYLYWTGASWIGAFNTDPFDMDLMINLPAAVMIIEKVIEVNESFEHGAAHELLISYYGSLPEAMGGSEQKARAHFNKAVSISKGLKAGPYLALATSVCIKGQYADEYKDLINKVIKTDVSTENEHRLLNLIAQEKAGWLLEHIDDFFI